MFWRNKFIYPVKNVVQSYTLTLCGETKVNSYNGLSFIILVSRTADRWMFHSSVPLYSNETLDITYKEKRFCWSYSFSSSGHDWLTPSLRLSMLWWSRTVRGARRVLWQPLQGHIPNDVKTSPKTSHLWTVHWGPCLLHVFWRMLTIRSIAAVDINNYRRVRYST